MSILFVLLMFLLVMSISYFRTRHEVPAQPQEWAGPQVPRMQREYGFSIPEGYAFHPGHTWVLEEGGEPLAGTPDQQAKDLAEEEAKWGALVRKLGIKSE